MEIRDDLLTGAIQRPTPNRSGGMEPKLVVLHDTAGFLAGTGSVAWLRNPASKASAHLVIGRAGEIWQLAPFIARTWHAGPSNFNGIPSVNDFAIGIELVNPGRLQPHGPSQAKAWHGEVYGRAKYGIEYKETPNHGAGLWMPYTQAQIAAVLGILEALRREYPGITEVTTHWFVSPGRKVDPNPLFPFKYIQSRFEGRADNDPEAERASTRVASDTRKGKGVTTMFSLLRKLFDSVDGVFGDKAKGVKTETAASLYLMLGGLRDFICLQFDFCITDGTYDIVQGVIGWAAVVFLGARLNRPNGTAPEAEV